ncbi:uncharacterized protein LOC130714556 [Lotus japonicus]|uniref:uncharacterized protein LOC130714556 n=1 Tax=Lotus japonicus TaxID=34305 RepID=UPI0025886F6D|nr:uncharacterized protein LOC130714556 [Lotus japonicus]
MKTKKKVKAVAEADAGQDLDSAIHEHALFFDKLIELIPAKFYLPTDEDKPWVQGLSKAKRAAMKKETVENIKKSRKDRLDPDKPAATTLDLLKERLGKEKESDGEKGVAGRSVTYEELRERLHRKLEGFRSGRNNENSDRARKREERSIRRGYDGNKRKRDSEAEESKPAPDELAEKVKKDAAEASKELVFGQVKLQNEEILGKKKRKVSKHKELEMAKKLEEVKKNDPEKGEALAIKESWKAAMNRASGIKVHDDPKLIQKSLKKEKKKQEKNAEKWKERIQTREQLKAGKQQKRSDNIAERIQDKKRRKIAKREKKLLRPGFEGRKEGFMNAGPA